LAAPSHPAGDSTRTGDPGLESEGIRSFQTFLPTSEDRAEEPARQLVQLLLDRQSKTGYESYMIQVLFRGRPSDRHVHRVYDDRVEIDFLDTGKPAMRLARVRGGAIEATSLQALRYRDKDGDTVPNLGSVRAVRSRNMVRLTLHTRERPVLRFRNTLDRTLIHFRVPVRDPGTATIPSTESGN
jgi:hypothetical protein